jgi:hypothetical protein
VTSREWNGRMHRVAVLVDGFAWNGRTYPSVSKIALPITGTRWNDTAGRPGRRLDFQRPLNSLLTVGRESEGANLRAPR